MDCGVTGCPNIVAIAARSRPLKALADWALATENPAIRAPATGFESIPLRRLGARGAYSQHSPCARWQALSGIVTADRALANALEFFEAQLPMQTSRSPRGRTGALHRQAVARAMALAWRQLTGQKECQVQRPAPGCDRHYVRTSPQRAKFGIGDKDGGGPQRGRESLGPNREPSKQTAHNHSIGA
jgi:hypothetical protein